MNEELGSILLGTAGLWIVVVVALVLTLVRGAIHASGSRLRTTVRVATVATLAQGAHFVEELATGFHRRFPELLGLEPWPLGFFVVFNLSWLLIWGLSTWSLAARRWAPLFPLWFLALAAVVNLVAHPLLALRQGGYFPGLLSSPFLGVAGGLLLLHLAHLTEHREEVR